MRKIEGKEITIREKIDEKQPKSKKKKYNAIHKRTQANKKKLKLKKNCLHRNLCGEVPTRSVLRNFSTKIFVGVGLFVFVFTLFLVGNCFLFCGLFSRGLEFCLSIFWSLEIEWAFFWWRFSVVREWWLCVEKRVKKDSCGAMSGGGQLCGFC
jgi:hypothetical protein